MRWSAIYVRVSSNRQEFRSQLPDLKAWTDAYTKDETVKWYKDKATGETMDRPGWRRLERDIRAGKVSRLGCWRLDRLGRDAAGLVSLSAMTCNVGMSNSCPSETVLTSTRRPVG